MTATQRQNNTVSLLFVSLPNASPASGQGKRQSAVLLPQKAQRFAKGRIGALSPRTGQVYGIHRKNIEITSFCAIMQLNVSFAEKAKFKYRSVPL
jgi:hypothetical protein